MFGAGQALCLTPRAPRPRHEDRHTLELPIHLLFVCVLGLVPSALCPLSSSLPSRLLLLSDAWLCHSPHGKPCPPGLLPSAGLTSLGHFPAGPGQPWRPLPGAPAEGLSVLVPHAVTGDSDGPLISVSVGDAATLGQPPSAESVSSWAWGELRLSVRGSEAGSSLATLSC